MAPQSEKNILAEAQIAQLPPVVKTAIESVHIPEQLRKLNDTHSLHIDQWGTLQDIVMASVAGLEPVSSIPQRLQSELHLDESAAVSIAIDIHELIFEPIRAELERGLGSPQAKAVVDTEIEAVRKEAITQERASGAPVPVAATPPAPQPTEKAARAVLSTSYAPAQPSHERKEIDGDPYRFPVE